MDGTYDEFGNLIGQIEESSSEESSSSSSSSEEEEEENAEVDLDEEEVRLATGELTTVSGSAGALVLHEDKAHYASNEEIYGKDTQVLVGEEDTQPIEQPIIPKKTTVDHHSKTKDKSKKLKHQESYHHFVLSQPSLVRNICFVGNHSHGKTTFMDYLMGEEGRVCDIRLDEQSRGLSIKGTPVSMLVENEKQKNYCFNMMDSPGHITLIEEAVAGMRLSDGVVVVVDVIEGLMLGTEKILTLALQEGVPMVLVLNKIDRLILELHIPPQEAYMKMLHVISEINTFMVKTFPTGSNGEVPRFSPELHNVVFASAKYNYTFTLKSFAKMYSDANGGNVNVDRFAARLWGNIFYSAETKRFTKEREDDDDQLSFVTFILEPLYKLTAITIAEDGKTLNDKLWESAGIRLWKNEAKLDADPLLKVVAGRFFNDASGFVQCVVGAIPSPLESAKLRIPRILNSEPSPATKAALTSCDAAGPLMVNITKLLFRGDGSGFDALGRVWSGTLHARSQVRVLGEHFSEDDPEHVAIAETNNLWLPQGRHKLDAQSAPAGSWVLIEGVDASIIKTATVCARDSSETAIFTPLNFGTNAIIKLAVEPLVPSDLPKMVKALQMINKSYPSASTVIEDSGEHVIFGTGELHLDSIMHDLRKLFSDIEVKVADPVTKFCETVIETSALKCFGESNNKKNKLTMIAEPLDKDLAKVIEAKELSLDMDKKTIRQYLETNFGWDTLAARSVWAFGPDSNGPNMLLDDTLPSEVDRKSLLSVKEGVVRGFEWATREGPLCDEQIRNVKFKLLDAQIADEPMARNLQQIRPTTRRVAFSAFLMSTPRLMEPWYEFEVICPEDCLAGVQTIISRRRGHIVDERKKPGTPLFIARGALPCMDSFGLETDIRTHTWGQAYLQSCFSEWLLAPGDPLDKELVLRPLEPSQPTLLGRDYMVKTRRRKGLAEDVTVAKYFDDPLLLELARQEVDIQF